MSLVKRAISVVVKCHRRNEWTLHSHCSYIHTMEQQRSPRYVTKYTQYGETDLCKKFHTSHNGLKVLNCAFTISTQYVQIFECIFWPQMIIFMYKTVGSQYTWAQNCWHLIIVCVELWFQVLTLLSGWKIVSRCWLSVAAVQNFFADSITLWEMRMASLEKM